MNPSDAPSVSPEDPAQPPPVFDPPLSGFQKGWLITDLCLAGFTVLGAAISIISATVSPETQVKSAWITTQHLVNLLAGAVALVAGIALLRHKAAGLALGWAALALVLIACAAAAASVPDVIAHARAQLATELAKHAEGSPERQRLEMASSFIVIGASGGIIFGIVVRLGLNAVYLVVLRRIAARWRRMGLAGAAPSAS